MQVPGWVARLADWFTILYDHVRDWLVEEHVVGSYDFDFITPRVACGAAPVDDGFIKALVAAGITHVIDVTDAEDDRSLLPANFPYLYNPTADDGQPKPTSWFKTSLDFALPALSDKVPDTKVYAHCTAGINRGPSTAYCILRAQGLTADAVHARFLQARPKATLAYAPDAERALKELGY